MPGKAVGGPQHDPQCDKRAQPQDRTTVLNNVQNAVCRCRKRNEEERWDRDLLLGVTGNPWSLQD